MKYQISLISDIGKIRSVNQDNFICNGLYRIPEQDIFEHDDEVSDPANWFAAVFDGMGGEKDGEVASLLAADLASDYDESKDKTDIKSMIMEINARICNEMAERRCRMGSTCVFAEFNEDRVRSWNLGDSRAYLFKDGELTQMTQDHTEAASLMEIFIGQGVKKGNDNALTQHLGISDDDFIIEPFASEWRSVDQGDIVLLCSDGLTHMVCDDEISAVLSLDLTLRERRNLLYERALENGGIDNITIILVEAVR